ncbi:similar to Saccharomyces cerevisiae YGL096W TOS8 Homeodomain- containing protein and putative transcription factor found associated with chromatin [Maudiozyma barnettii]|uniref:Similar to Saccharomyces cerevisiae YGL096W TOS8 Homeodomain- containing protein and putative transcription factor found associated with chromatin n=1 Tax=Maudiozyma barnettii TaxID=61262 RepID=A0A8H2VEW8_9SACH|nr:Tos8p [Kazachstania barnettii]CAB4254265.1 similar to Saccharomyces cerevisiae YGL096W TOS8 Homeodomain- containing protein and putative transcription factor found associated with chromatin [Kazachstania barnettii]CAD1782041.1 similar to Saccharomyces cerevisiae YGL096W TOS8 Homeodomain- containing protein and putative transcription factor found associated with chromatin [Kazachstania barnettii]
MSFQTKQTKISLPPIKNLFDALDINELNKTPPMKNIHINDIQPSLNGIHTIKAPQLSPLFSNTNNNSNIGYTINNNGNSSASNSPLNYSEYSNYYNYIRQPIMPTQSTSVHSHIPYQNHYQSQRYTANIVGSSNHNEIPRSDAPSSLHMNVAAGPAGVPMIMSPHMHHPANIGAQLVLTGHSSTLHKEKKSHRMTGKRSNLPKETVKILNNWLVNHLNNPYPTPAEKNVLLSQTGLTKIQLSNWFINVRRRKVFTDHFDKKFVQNKMSSSNESSPSAQSV